MCPNRLMWMQLFSRFNEGCELHNTLMCFLKYQCFQLINQSLFYHSVRQLHTYNMPLGLFQKISSILKMSVVSDRIPYVDGLKIYRRVSKHDPKFTVFSGRRLLKQKSAIYPPCCDVTDVFQLCRWPCLLKDPFRRSINGQPCRAGVSNKVYSALPQRQNPSNNCIYLKHQLWTTPAQRWKSVMEPGKMTLKNKY